jgi:hypothetical protein
MKTVEEKTRFTVTCKLRNGTTPTAPTTLDYRVDCRTTKQVILNWTAIDPANSVTVTMLPAYSEILDSTNLIEQKSITFSANRGTDLELNKSYIWEVKNLLGVM